MDRARVLFLEILNTALQGGQFTGSDAVSAEDWQEVLRLAEIHKLLPLIYQAAYTVPALREMPAVRAKMRRQVVAQTVRTSEFLQLYGMLREAGVTPLVVKGIVCRELYPEPDLRISSDEDILIPAEQFDRCRAVMEAYGMRTPLDEEALAETYEAPFRKQDGVLYIELHKSLFPPESDAYGDWNRFFDGAFARARDAGAVRTLSHTDHVLYLLCHAFKHFLHSGFGIRQVCDIVMYLNAYGAEVDWNRVYESCCAIRAEVFAAALFKIGRKHLGLDDAKACIPDDWRETEVDETDMLEDLLSGGVYGSASESRVHSSNITLDAVAADKRGKRAGASLKNSLFPSAKSLEGRYPYLKKHPYLLPAAWISRIVRYGRGAGNGKAAEAVKIGSERVELLRKYRVIR